jgi:hypothetical protein
MNENTELLMHIYQSAEMGVYTTTNLLDLLKNKDNKIKPILQQELKEYEKYTKLSEEYLEKLDTESKTSGIMAKLGSDIGMTIETMKDNSDSRIASMLVEGMTMGILEMTGKIESYKKICKKDIIVLAEELKQFQEKEIEKLKQYV